MNKKGISTIWIIAGLILLFLLFSKGKGGDSNGGNDVECTTTQDCKDYYKSCITVCSFGKCYFTGDLMPHQLGKVYPECEFRCEEGYHKELIDNTYNCCPDTHILCAGYWETTLDGCKYVC